MHRAVLLLATLVAAIWLVPAAFAKPQLQIVAQNDGYLTLAVDQAGVAYGEQVPVNGVYSNSLYRSTDEGQTWTPLYDFPAATHLYTVSVLGTGTLLAHVDTGAMKLYRSNDGGVTWTKTLSLPTTSVFYTTLTSHSISDLVANDGRYVFVGSYNTGDGGDHTNYIWRSSDDGQTWSLVYTSTTHRHIHFVQANPYADEVYVGYGDSGSQVSIERSTDHGLTWTPVCSGDPCTAVDLAFDPSGFGIFGQDRPFTTSYIEKIDLATGTLTQLAKLPGPSYSALHLSPSVWLVGETHEPNMTDDGNVHLFASDDGGRSFIDVHSWPYASVGGYARMTVQFAYPNGDFSIRIDGYGTIVGRIVPAPDFDVAASPSVQSVNAGTAAEYRVSVSSVGGFSDDVALTLDGLPEGATVMFASPSVDAPGDAILTVATNTTTPAGSYALTLTGASGDASHSTVLTLTVTTPPEPTATAGAGPTGSSPPPPAASPEPVGAAPELPLAVTPTVRKASAGFSVGAGPATRTVARGASAAFTIAVGSTGGFRVMLRVAGLPRGATATISTRTVNGSRLVTLKIKTSAKTPRGRFRITVTGTSGQLKHQASVTLVVT